MRVSNSMLSSSVMTNMSGSLDRMLNLQNQVSSGKRLTRATDDPVGTGRDLNYRSALASSEQYGKNLLEGKSRLNQMDASLDSIAKNLQSAKQLALSASSSTSSADPSLLVDQVQQTIDSIVSEANAKHLDRQLYGGGQNTTASVTANPSGTPPYQYNGDDGVTSIQVNDSTRMDVSLTAKQVLNMDGATDSSVPDVLTVLTGLKENLAKGDLKGIEKSMGQIDASYNNVLNLRGSMGLKSKQVDLYTDRNTDVTASLKDSIAEEEGADLPQAITDLQMEQNVYQASLLAASRIVQPSLADFLK